MRIFYASDTTPNASFESNLWRNNLLLPLLDLGHDAIEFDYNLRETFQNLNPDYPEHKAFIEKNRPRVSVELLRQIKAAHKIKPIDVFFSYFTDACVVPETIDEIRAIGIKTINWYCNGSYLLHLVAEISPHYDWCLVPERFRLHDYIEMGARPIYCQEAANPEIYKPYDLPFEFDVTFVGQAYGERPKYIKYLLNKGIDIRVWGHGWKKNSYEIYNNPLRRGLHIGEKILTSEGLKALNKRLLSIISKKIKNNMPNSRINNIVNLPDHISGGVLSDIEMVKMYSRSKINLGFSACGNTHGAEERIVQIRLRDFEVPMSGGFYILEYMEELEEFYEIGKELICYNGPADLAEKIKYYLSHNTEREAIRKAGYERCLRDHTWHKRFEMVFHKIGLS